MYVRNTFLPPNQFPLIGDGPRTNAYNARYAASSPPTGITAALDFLRWMAAKGAAYFFIDVHFSGLSSRDLCSAAKQKTAEYLKAWNNFRSNVVTPAQKELLQLYRQVNHSQNGNPAVFTFGINYDGFIDPCGRRLLMYFAAMKYPEDPNNRSYQVSRQRWISHYIRRIQQVLNNVVAPAISLTLRNLVSTSNTQVLMDHDHLEPPSSQVPEFRRGEEAHDDHVAYASMGDDGHFQSTSESIFNDQENTALPPDKADPDFELHDVRTPVPKIAVQSVNQDFTTRRLPMTRPTDVLNLDDSAASSTSVLDLDIDEIAASTTMVPHTTDHNRTDANNNPINHVAHSKNISAIINGSNTPASIVNSSVDDVSSTVESITDGSNLKKRNLPTNDTSGSDSIASRVKVLRRPTNKKQKQSRPPGTAPASPGSKQ